MVPILVFTVVNHATHLRAYDARSIGTLLAYILFDSLMWIGVAFLIFAVIEQRQKMPPQSRIAAMGAATVCIAGLATTLIMFRALFGSILHDRPFVSELLLYLPAPFFAAVFYVAIVTGIGYAVYSWAVDDRRLAEAAELDAAIARAELKAASGRLQPELLDAALARLSTLMVTDVAGAQRMISDLGALLHDSFAGEYLGVPRSTSEFLGGEGDPPEELRGTRGTPRHPRNSE
jgi:hypothetical protein